MDTRATDHVIAVGEVVEKTVRFTQEDILLFARMSHDENPLHIDSAAAEKARFGRIIASGQHTAAILMGMLATHYSRQDDGVQREMLCLNMNFAFKSPVFADTQLKFQWKVASVEWNSKLQGLLSHLDGCVCEAPDKPMVVARGTILVKEVHP